MKCLCNEYAQELSESAKLIAVALGYDTTFEYLWNRDILMDLINDYARLRNELNSKQ